MAKQVRWHYTVTGNGRFPFDMLRYDQAWPEDTGGEMTEDRFESKSDLGTVRRTREQKLVGLNAPTVERWASFGWYVVRDSVEKRTF